MQKRPLLISVVISGLLAMLIIALTFAVSDVMSGELTIPLMCLSPFWLLLCGVCGALLYRRLSGALSIRAGALVGALGGLFSALVPFVGLIIVFFMTSDIDSALSGTAFFAYVGAFLAWIPLVWIASAALGGMLAAAIFRRIHS